MKLKVFEYLEKDKNGKEYECHYTIKEDCDKEKELQKKFHSKHIQTIEEHKLIRFNIPTSIKKIYKLKPGPQE